jgi:hypothetical protein
LKVTLRKQPMFIGFWVVLWALSATAQDPQSSDAQSSSGGGQQAEYAGPSILSRGSGSIFRAPTQPIKFAPFVSVGAAYDTGLTAVTIRPDGTIPKSSSWGMYGGFGLSGYQRFKRSTLSADYGGSYSHYQSGSYFNGGQSRFGLAYSNNLSRRTTFGYRVAASMMNRGFYNEGYDAYGSLDPDSNGVPRNEIFDGQTWFISNGVDMTYRKSARLSFHMGGNYGVIRRRSSSLVGAQTIGARSDVAYRITRNMTTGVSYNFSHFDFTKGYGGADVHSVGLLQSMRLGRRWELGGNFGVALVDSFGLRRISVDPVIAAILGQTAAVEAVRNRNLTPNISAHLTRGFRRASAHMSYFQGVSSGNGVYLTSRFQSITGGFGYSGFKKWSLGAQAFYNTFSALTQTVGKFSGYSGGVHVGRQIIPKVSYNFGADAYRFSIGSGNGFDRLSYRFTTGLSFSPGEFPLRIW